MKEIISGVYKITNLLNGKVYIGQSVNLSRRYKEHFSKSHCSHLKDSLHKDMLKEGFENFSFEIIKETYDLDYWETFMIHLYRSFESDKGYNLTSGGSFGTTKYNNYIYTDNVKKKMSDKAKLRWQNSEERQKVIDAQNKGKQTEEWKEKRREIANRMWQNGEFKNQAKKLSEYWMGKPKSAETRNNMSKAQKERAARCKADYLRYCELGGMERYRVFIKYYHKTPYNDLLMEKEKDYARKCKEID